MRTSNEIVIMKTCNFQNKDGKCIMKTSVSQDGFIDEVERACSAGPPCKYLAPYGFLTCKFKGLCSFQRPLLTKNKSNIKSRRIRNVKRNSVNEQTHRKAYEA